MESEQQQQEPAAILAEEAAIELRDYAQRILQRNLLRWAVGRALFCRGCETILDWRRAALVTTEEPSSAFVLCRRCWEQRGGLEAIRSRILAALQQRGLTEQRIQTLGLEAVEGWRL